MGMLSLDAPGQFVANRVEEMVSAGSTTADIRAMAVLAQALGANNPVMDSYLK